MKGKYCQCRQHIDKYDRYFGGIGPYKIHSVNVVRKQHHQKAKSSVDEAPIDTKAEKNNQTDP